MKKQQLTEREKFLLSRAGGIGSSDCGSILALPDAYSTPYEVYLSKLDPLGSAKDENLSMLLGNLMEPVLDELFRRQTGYDIVPHPKMYKHKEYDFLCANIDGLIKGKAGDDGDGVLEHKTADVFAHKNWADSEGNKVDITMNYYSQIQHSMNVTGLTWGYFSLLIGGNNYQVWRVERDDEFISLMQPQLINFWQNNVQKQVPPELINMTDLKKAFAKSIAGTIVEADEDILYKLKMFVSLKNQAKQLDADIEVVEFELKKFMGENEVLTYNDNVIATYKSSADSLIIDGKKLEFEHPDLYKNYLKTKNGGRRFITKIGA